MALTLCLLACANSTVAQSFDALLEQAISFYWSANYQEEIAILASLCDQDLPDDGAVECFKYLGFGYVAVGKNDLAQRAFVELLSIDARHALDETGVAPKIREQFEASRRSLVESLFAEAKEAYTSHDHRAAMEAFGRVLSLDPEHVVAREYLRLASELAALGRAKSARVEDEAALEADATPDSSVAVLPAAPNSETRVYHLTDPITPPVPVAQVTPRYPLSARGAGLEGIVTVSAIVRADGSVSDVAVVRSVSRDFDRESVRAMQQWRYEPALLDGQAVSVYTLVHFRFELGRVSVHPASESELEPDEPGAAGAFSP